MSRFFSCPSCSKMVSLAQIRMVYESGSPPEWYCRLCNGQTASDQWGLSSDGVPAPSFFFYEGAAKQESSLKKDKFARAVARPTTFAASLPIVGSYSKVRKKMQYDPQDGIADYETVAIYHVAERYVLMGRYFSPTAGTPDKVVLLLSGSGGVAAEQLGKVAHRYLKRLKAAVLMMDYRGFGGSDRKAPSEQGLFTDARAMYAYLTKDDDMGGLGWRPDQVVIHGYSLGTGVAADLATRKKNCAGLVLQCPFTSAAAMAKERGGSIGGWLGKHSGPMDVKGKLGGLSTKVLLLIANQDDMKPHGDDLRMTFNAKSVLGNSATQSNFTVAYYDGEHLEPGNAFKDGWSKKKTIVEPKDGGGYKNVGDRYPSRGDKMLKDPGGALDADNVKESTGGGCIQGIQKWFTEL